MYTKTLISNDNHRAIMIRSHHNRFKARTKPETTETRTDSQFGTKSYRDALQRAFNRAKMQIYFNPDMKNFITLTYAKADNSVEEVLHDVKMLVKRERRSRGGDLKYVFVLEYQKRGSIHVHMIANDFLSIQVNKNGYKELVHWQKGFSSVLTINDFDSNFRPYLYLFKYMRKSQRIGHSFVHSSRNLNNFTDLQDNSIDLMQWRTLTQEHIETTILNTNFTFIRNYLQFDDTIASQPLIIGGQKWLELVKSHTSQASAKLAKSRSQA